MKGGRQPPLSRGVTRRSGRAEHGGGQAAEADWAGFVTFETGLRADARYPAPGWGQGEIAGELVRKGTIYHNRLQEISE